MPRKSPAQPRGEAPCAELSVGAAAAHADAPRAGGRVVAGGGTADDLGAEERADAASAAVLLEVVPHPILRVEYANIRARIRYCAAYSEHRVNTTEKNTVNTAEYG